MLSIEPLAKKHDRKGFDCGDRKLNEFLQRTAKQHAEREISRTFVLVDNDAPEKIVGYYTLTVCEVIPEQIDDPRLQRYPHPMPAAKLARLAICANHQQKGFGQNLLLNAMERSEQISENVGLIGLFVDAKDENAAGYYKRFGFVPTNNNPLVLFLSIATIRQAHEE